MPFVLYGGASILGVCNRPRARLQDDCSCAWCHGAALLSGLSRGVRQQGDWSRRWFLYATLSFVMFVFGEFGEVVSGRWTMLDAVLGVASEAVCFPMSAFITQRLLGRARRSWSADYGEGARWRSPSRSIGRGYSGTSVTAIPFGCKRRLRVASAADLAGVAAGPRRRPAPGKWSVVEIVAHLADAELAMGWRFRNMLATPGVSLQWWDEQLWSEVCGYSRVPVAKSLGVFRTLRDANLALLRSVPRQRWQSSYGVHDKRGRRTGRSVRHDGGGPRPEPHRADHRDPEAPWVGRRGRRARGEVRNVDSRVARLGMVNQLDAAGTSSRLDA